jgi:hypothetical protein
MRPSETKKLIHTHTSLTQDRSQRSLRHIPWMVGNGGVPMIHCSIPDLMRTCSLAIKREAQRLEAPNYITIAKT